MDKKYNACLSDLKPGEKAKVTEFRGGEGLKQKLESLGIRLGKDLMLVSKQPTGGPLVVRIDEMEVALGFGMAQNICVEVDRVSILLMGNPNVGKSVVFSRLTGLDVISSNYAGTTVDYTIGNVEVGDTRVKLIDVPGAYTLDPISEAEKVAKEMINSGNAGIIINAVDATNLERNLFLTLQILERRKPTIIILNKWDSAKLRGISIDTVALGKLLGVPVIPFVAMTGEGIKELLVAVKRIMEEKQLPSRDIPKTDDGKWQLIGEISRSIQTVTHKHPTLLEKLADASIKPVTGFPMAIAFMILTFYTIRLVGEGLINWVLDPLFNKFYYPVVSKYVPMVAGHGILKDILLGKSADYMASFGVLTTGIYIPFVVVLPYIFVFYFILGFLEDLGYIPRLAVLLDRFMHKLGVHGYATIPLMLGLGCKIPSLLATRILETRRERIIANFLVLMIAPCMPQSAMIFSVLGKFGMQYVFAVFAILFTLSILSGMILNKFLKGEAPELFVEIPAYQLPRADILIRKGWMRVRHFIFEAVPMIIGGVFVMCILELIGVVDLVANTFGPVLAKLLGLPKEISSVMLLGFLRKEISIALLIPFHLTPGQLVVAAVFLSIYLPCLATTFILLKEMKWRDTLIIVSANFIIALSAGALLNLLLKLF